MYWFIATMLSIFLGASTAFAQTSGFTYQGRLTDGSAPASGPYDLQFSLWDSQSSGTQIGSTQSINGIQITSGVFTVTLDFGANAFPGASRFLEISARVSGGGSFTLLTPRQAITSTPYAVRSLNASTADNIPVSGVPAGSGNYIQNTSSQQSANLNINGNATAGGTMSGNVVSAATQFNINGNRILSNGGLNNLFVGINSGAANMGNHNAFFGSTAGAANTTGTSNSFFGAASGKENTSGNFNTFFGQGAGPRNLTGNSNSFFGSGAGLNNTSGTGNSFFGSAAGQINTTGGLNTAIGYFASVVGDSTNATAIGANALVTQSNSLVLGSVSGSGGATDTNVGIGTTAPNARLHVRANGGNILLGDAGCGTSFGGIGFGSSLSGCNNYALLGGGDANTYINRPAGGTIIFRENNSGNQLEIRPGGVVGIGTLDTEGSVQLCRNSVAAISTCSSSLRYKTEVKPFLSGLQLINRLQPVKFNWKTSQQADIGLIAEEVAKVDPLFTFKNDKGEIEGVKYSNLSVVFINAFKEQQLQIEVQRKEIEKQQQQIDSLKRLVCADHPTASICKSN